MLKKVKDFVTYGPIDDAVFNELINKRGQPYLGREKDSKGIIDYSRKFYNIDGKKYKKFFRLNPPVGGFKTTKKSVARGGALGPRKDIAELIKRMI